MFISLFPAGETSVSSKASESLLNNNRHLVEFILNHTSGRWGRIAENERRVIEKAVEKGGRILSRYTIEDGTVIVVMTDVDKNHGKENKTAIMLADEFGK